MKKAPLHVTEHTSASGGTGTRTTRTRRYLRWLLFVALLIVGFVVASVFDRPVYQYLRSIDDDPGQADFLRMLFNAGYWPVWLIVAMAFLLIDMRRYAGARFRRITRRAELLIWPPALAGIVGAIMKLLLRRERPMYHDGAYVFRSFEDRPFFGGGLGLPSTHAAVAFAAGYILCRMYPAATPVWLFVALGCGFARIESGAHFVTDVYLGALVGILAGLVVWKAHLALTARHEGVPQRSAGT